ncbi:MAG TPA: adenylosuccinate synthetase [Micromonosporaceae bacterium]
MSHTIVLDLGYGDAGKGSVVDWLCASRPVHAVIRFNGGGQAGHNVVTTDGRHHTFSQFGSGTLQGVRTHLSRFMIVDPLSMAAEADHLVTLGIADPWTGLTIDRDAPMATPYHRAANQARERARGDARHGSCGMGIGEATAYALAHPDLAPRAGDVLEPERLGAKLTALRESVLADFGGLDLPDVEDCLYAYRAFTGLAHLVDGSYTATLLDGGDCVFEAAQGVLLDEWRGFHPYTTWSTTTAHNALELLDGRPVTTLGVVRTYTTRHGAGPLVTADDELTDRLPDAYNREGPWQGGFRAGHFDAVAHRYAVEVSGGIDALAVTHADVRNSGLGVCRAYQEGFVRIEPGTRGDLDHQAALTAALATARPIIEPVAPEPGLIGELLDRPVALVSSGPTAADKQVLTGVNIR